MSSFIKIISVTGLLGVLACCMWERSRQPGPALPANVKLVRSEPPAPALQLKKNDTVVFIGATNMVRMQQAGIFESMVVAGHPRHQLKVRDLAWEADTVFAQGTAIERWRRDGFGGRDNQYKFVKATVVVAQFGKLESMAGQPGLARFVRAYGELLDGIGKQTKRVVLVSPLPFERPASPLVPDVTRHNASLKLYVKAIRQIAQQRGLPFVDLFHGAPRGLTENGMHVTRHAQKRLAAWMAQQFRLSVPPARQVKRLHSAVREKCRLWYDYWRPANWKLLYGDDSKRIFTRGGKNYPPFRVEWMRLRGLIDKADRRIWTVAGGGEDPGHNRPQPEKLHAAPDANIKKELASFTVLDGLRVNLFAAENLGITSPLAIRWDGAGRMYVTISTTYPHVFPGDVPNDKIILLEDTNRDGVADKSTVFADKLNIPTGLELGNGGVYVGQATEILFLKDTDGDGKADVRKVLLGGFGNGDSHQTINSFIWSPDGELFFGQGDGCESRVETPWGSSNLFQAGFYRLRPERLQLDPLLDDFMGPGNPWGVAFDDWGQIFSIDGAGGVTFLSPGQIPVHHRKRLKRIGSPGGYCGIGFLDGRHLPSQLRGDFVIGDFKPHRIKRFSVVQQGGGFELKWKKPLLTSKHRNFRPIDVKVGPDGAIYVVDWYNPVTCHQDDSYRVPTRDKAHGRIWRISSSAPVVTPPDLTRASDKELANALKSPERWTRYQAKRVMTQRDRAGIARALRHMVAQTLQQKKPNEHHLFEALAAFATIEVVEPALLSRLLESTDYRARAFATRVTGRWHDRLPDPLALLQRRVVDAHPLVRMEAVVACAAIPSPRAIEVAARVTDQKMDYWLDYVFTQAVHQLEPHWLPAFQRGARAFAEPGPLAAVLSKSSGHKVLAGLKKIAQSTNHSREIRSSAMAAVIAAGSAKDYDDWVMNEQSFVVNGRYAPGFHAEVLGKLADSVRLKPVRRNTHASSLHKLLQSKHTRLVRSAVQLAGLWNVTSTGKQILSIAANEDNSGDLRSAAFLAVARLRPSGGRKMLDKYAADENLSIRTAAIRALTLVDVQAAAVRATATIKATKPARVPVADLLQAFLDRKGGAEVLGQQVAKVKLPAKSAEALLSAVYGAGRSDEALVKPLNQLIGLSGKAPEFSREYLASVVKEALAKGNAKRGAVIFRSKKLSCLKCHTVGKEGGVVGPNLTAIGSTLSVSRITEELMWPQKQVKEGFTLLQVVTEDGKVHQGYQRQTRESRQTGDVVLRELTRNRFYTIRKDEIEASRVVGSAMPQGLTAGMTKSELHDLIRYLVSLRK